jgi:hypothetical protein
MGEISSKSKQWEGRKTPKGQESQMLTTYLADLKYEVSDTKLKSL